MLDAGLALQLLDLLGRHVADVVELARDQPLGADDRAGDVAKDDLVEIGLAGFPIVGEALELDVTALHPGLEDEGARADGIGAEVLAELLGGRGRDHEARPLAEQACMDLLNFANWRGPRIYLDPGEKLSEAAETDLKKRLTYDFVAPRALFFGSPDVVAAKILELHEATGLDHLIFKCGWPSLAHEHTMRALKRLTTEVLPVVRKKIAARKAARVAAE